MKAVVVGDTAAGKTSLSERFCYGDAAQHPNPTIGASFLQKRIQFTEKSGSYSVSLQLWDTAGQERFRSMAPMYYRGATAAIVVFDVTKSDSWLKVETWHRDLSKYAEPGVVIGVAGNKTDLPAAPDFDEAACRAQCAKWGASFHLTSAVSGDGVDDLFLSVAKRAVTVRTSYQPGGTVSLEETQHHSSAAKSGTCC